MRRSRKTDNHLKLDASLKREAFICGYAASPILNVHRFKNKSKICFYYSSVASK
jgi:hypothetical protein